MNTETNTRRRPFEQLIEFLDSEEIPYELFESEGWGNPASLYYPERIGHRAKVTEGNPLYGNLLTLSGRLVIPMGMSAGSQLKRDNEPFLTSLQIYYRIEQDWQIQKLEKRVHKLEHLVDILSPSIIERGSWE